MKKKYFFNVDAFEDNFCIRSKYGTYPRQRGNIEINDEERYKFIKEQVDQFTSALIKNIKCVNMLSFYEFKTLYGEDSDGNAICPECGSIIREEDWEKDGRRCWFCGFMGDEEDC